MKVEKLDLDSIPKKQNGLMNALRGLKKGQAIRLSTARDFAHSAMYRSRIAKERGLRFGQAFDGDDVLIFIKP